MHALLVCSCNRLTQVAIPWFVLQTTGSVAKTGLVGFAARSERSGRQIGHERERRHVPRSYNREVAAIGRRDRVLSQALRDRDDRRIDETEPEIRIGTTELSHAGVVRHSQVNDLDRSLGDATQHRLRARNSTRASEPIQFDERRSGNRHTDSGIDQPRRRQVVRIRRVERGEDDARVKEHGLVKASRG